MLKLIKKVSKKKGMRPGALVYVGEKKAAGPAITLVDYDEKSITEKEVASIEECLPFRDSPTVTWVNIDGVHETEVIEKAGGIFGMHPLVLEDIVNTGQRPKLEDFDDYLYVTLKMLRYDEDSGELGAEHISLILGRIFVISFQEEQGDVFDPVRERIRKSKGRIRKSGPDYLLYALVDAVVDNYFVMLEKMAAKIEKLEDELLEKASPETSHAIHKLKTDLIFLRKSVWPLRDLVSGLEKSESDLVNSATVPYLRDLYDHTIQVMDTIESLRDMVSGMLDIYLSVVSNRMNDIMKVLTIFASIFIPLTFVAGVYGMNFKYMPELEWHWGYFFVVGVMVTVALVMLLAFRRKKWL